MAQDAEIVLEDNRTKVVGPIDLSGSTDWEPNIELNPRNAEVSVGHGKSDDPGLDGSISVYDDTGDEAVALETNQNGGLLRTSSGFASVIMDADDDQEGRIEVLAEFTSKAVVLDNSDWGGRLTVRDTTENVNTVRANSTATGGRVELSTSDGVTTGEFDAGDASIVLTGRPERQPGTDDQVDPKPKYGGGEFLLQQFVSEPSPGDTPSSLTTDQHVHATAEEGSEYEEKYEDEDEKTSRILLHGPSATADLGRGRRDADRPGVAGEVAIRGRRGSELLAARGSSSVAPSDESGSEIVFHYDGANGREFKGAIRSHPKGLMIYDANDQQALLVRNDGKVLTREPVKESLPV